MYLQYVRWMLSSEAMGGFILRNDAGTCPHLRVFKVIRAKSKNTNHIQSTVFAPLYDFVDLCVDKSGSFHSMSE